MLYHLLGRKIVHIANGPSVGRMEGVWVNSLGISRAEGGQPAGGSRGGGRLGAAASYPQTNGRMGLRFLLLASLKCIHY